MSLTDSGLDMERMSALALDALPRWVRMAGYSATEFDVPERGELFYEPLRDKVLRCDAIESREFVILRYDRDGGE